MEFKIRLQVLRGQNFSQRFAPDDPALAVLIFQDGTAVAFAPKLVGAFFTSRIALRVILEAR